MRPRFFFLHSSSCEDTTVTLRGTHGPWVYFNIPVTFGKGCDPWRLELGARTSHPQPLDGTSHTTPYLSRTRAALSPALGEPSFCRSLVELSGAGFRGRHGGCEVRRFVAKSFPYTPCIAYMPTLTPQTTPTDRHIWHTWSVWACYLRHPTWREPFGENPSDLQDPDTGPGRSGASVDRTVWGFRLESLPAPSWPGCLETRKQVVSGHLTCHQEAPVGGCW